MKERLRRARLIVADIALGLFDLRDLFWIGGLSAAGYGIAMIYVPAAWIVCGGVVFWMGVRR